LMGVTPLRLDLLLGSAGMLSSSVKARRTAPACS
jgi:hypothetical protein